MPWPAQIKCTYSTVVGACTTSLTPEDAAALHLFRGKVLVEAREDVDRWGVDGEAAVVHGPDRASPAVGADVFDGLFTCHVSNVDGNNQAQTLARMHTPQPAGSGGCTASA